MRAELGLADASLQAGDIANAQCEADRFMQSALSTADPNLQALAWDLKTRVAMTEKNLTSGEKFLQNALAILAKFNVPVSVWRVHFTAWEFFIRKKDQATAGTHRAEAERGIFAIANSFEADEPLRGTFLAAEPVRKVLDAKPLKHMKKAIAKN
jgi:hypothetical protein